MSKHGRDFELAVYEFAKSLAPSAKVIFDHKVPDRDTGEPRQCDVWINTVFNEHWPLSILVSCKDHNRKLHVGDIGTFVDEIRSAGASMGVIYSKAGFTRTAFKKAKANGIACCRLYSNEPADIPQSLWLEQFTCSPQIMLVVKASPPTITTWNDLFDAKVNIGGIQRTILDIIVVNYHEGETQSVEITRAKGGFPQDWFSDVRFIDEDTSEEFWIQVVGRWKLYRARLEAHFLNGSYSLANESFRGTIAGPAIDLRGAHPGASWIEVTDDQFALPENRILIIRYTGDVEETLRAGLGPKPLPAQAK